MFLKLKYPVAGLKLSRHLLIIKLPLSKLQNFDRTIFESSEFLNTKPIQPLDNERTSGE
jgi:hypothetical protein